MVSGVSGSRTRSLIALKSQTNRFFFHSFHSLLQSHGVKETQLNHLMLEGMQYWKNQLKSDFIDFDVTKWLIHNCTRNDAEKLLDGKPSGTFLIRPRAVGHYALSIICNDMINHCILYSTERGYGFAEPYNIYGSLESLVQHYSCNSLEEHNDKLKTQLKFPIKCSFIEELMEKTIE